MTDLIRSAGLSYYPEVARSVGLDPRQMMRKVRLPLACLDKPDTPIAVTGLRRLLELSAEASGAEDFGLRLAERGGLTNFGAVGLIVREQATVGEAIEAFSRFIPIHHDGMKLDVTRNKQTVTVTLHLRGRQPTAPRQSPAVNFGRSVGGGSCFKRMWMRSRSPGSKASANPGGRASVIVCRAPAES